MIEITARQLYDIYRHLPNPEVAIRREFQGRYRVALQPDYTALRRATSFEEFQTIPEVQLREVEFEVDINVRPFEWKPRTDLIIKA